MLNNLKNTFSSDLCQSILETMLLQGYDSVLITDASNNPKITYTNSAFTQLTGYSADEILGKSPKILQGPSTSQEVIQRLRKCLIDVAVFEGEAVNYKKDGTIFMMKWRMIPIINNGELKAWLAIQREKVVTWLPE
jgi:PAS domain S-box-containing protein